MRTLMYNLLKYRSALKKLQRELDSAGLSRPFPRYDEVQGLPYLDACVLEAGRILPPVGVPMERVVPPEGVTISGQYIPAGTIVGANPYVVHRHTGTFGLDVEAWRPERWLDADEEQRQRMEQSLLTVNYFDSRD